VTPFIAILIIALAVAGVIFYKRPLKKVRLPDGYKDLLTQHVSFYRALDETGKIRFENKLKEFLGYIRITGVDTQVEDLDTLLVASSAVIPIFGFPEWRYYNLRDVWLYAEAFNADNYSTKGKGRDVLGMVGEGPMQMLMILSKPALREGFAHTSGKENAGIHEFVHLLDKEDGAVDGLPEALLERQYSLPWLNLMADNIAAIKAGKSDINIYGSKNKAEFLAVAAEYFFEQPEQFKQKHLALYELMTHIFHQSPPIPNTPAQLIQAEKKSSHSA
jgi:Mlc titration factor MtfA (ptsG expression regulator)